MDQRAVQARLFEQQLRLQVALLPVSLHERKAGAAVLDELFHDLVAVVGPDVFGEVGAFEASASQRVRTAVPTARVVAFEVSPVNHAHHAAHTDFAALGIDYVHSAVADHDGTITLLLNVDDAHAEAEVVGSTSLLRHGAAAEVREVEVPCTTLDTALAADEGRTAFWIDVEGAAGPVLRGGAASLARADVVKIEVEDEEIWPGQALAAEVIALLLDAGLVPVARDVEYPTQHNLIFLSTHALALPGVGPRLDRHLYDVAHRPEHSRLRQSESLRRVARPLRRMADAVRPAR